MYATQNDGWAYAQLAPPATIGEELFIDGEAR